MTSARLARERLERDITDAVALAAAQIAYRTSEPLAVKLKIDTLMNARDTIAENVSAALRRNWRVSERARGQRTVE